MPIYDYDGTTRYQIGKVYDYDGTARYQIGKVYDHDSTASHLIYTADTPYFDGGAVVPFTKDEYYSTITIGSTIYAKHGNQTAASTVRTTNKQDLTNISKITFTFSSVVNNGNAICRIAVGSATGGSVFVSNSNDWTVYKDISAAGTYSLDVSGLSGSYYIKIVQGVSTAYNSSFTCTKIIGE